MWATVDVDIKDINTTAAPQSKVFRIEFTVIGEKYFVQSFAHSLSLTAGRAGYSLTATPRREGRLVA